MSALLRVLLCAGVLAGAVPARGQTPPGALPFVTYGAEVGFGKWIVGDLAQDTQGLLWVGTDDGLYLHDGYRFQEAPREGLPSAHIMKLVAGPKGRMWCGTREGWALWSEGRWTRYGEAQGAPGLWHDLLVDGEGRAWVASSEGLFREREEGRFEPVAEWPGGLAKSLWRTARGDLYVVAPGALHHRAPDGRWLQAQELPLEDDLYQMALDGEGRLWVWSLYRLWQRAPGATTFEEVRSLESNRSLLRAWLDGHGTLWLGTDKGLVELGREGRPRVLTGPATQRVHTLFEDREGSLWVGGLGLFRLSGRGLWRTHGEREGLPGEELWSIRRDATGRLWAGTNKGLARATADGWEVERAVPPVAVRSIAPEEDGSLWLGGGWAELLRYEPDTGRLERLGASRGMTESIILDLELDQSGALWVATSKGLLRGEGRGRELRLVPVPLPGADPASLAIFDLARDAQGRMWISDERGLLVYEGGAPRRFTSEDGLREGAAGYLLVRRDGRLCTSYFRGEGLSCFRHDGRGLSELSHLDADTGLASNRVYHLGEDASGRLWVGTSKGVDVLGPDGREHFGMADGLPGDDCNARAFWADADGSVWVGTSTGLGQFLGSRYTGPPPPPEVELVSVRLGGHEPPSSAAPPEVPFELNLLEGEARARTLLDEARLLREVRLLELEPEWRLLEGHQLRYASLEPGRYELQARARRPHGPWGPTARFAFVVRPPWWRTGWSYAGALLGLGGLLALSFHLRERAVRRRNTLLEALVAQRTRELEHTQERLVQLEREATEQQMAGGFAHEMRNALTGAKMLLGTVMGATDGQQPPSVSARNGALLKELYLGVRAHLPPGERVHVARLLKELNGNEARLDKVLHDTDEALGRALAFTHLLLEYARLGRERPGHPRVRVAEVLESILGESREDLAAHAISVQLEGDRGCVAWMKPLHLYSVLKNLVLNARDALVEGPGAGERVLSISWSEEPEGTLLRVADTGAGMTAEVRERIFEPFFSTKPDRGTGLGLSVVRKLVTLYGGTLRVESEPGRGTSFTLTLPRAPEAEEPAA